MYKKARAGEIKEFTGISSPYEEPEEAEERVIIVGEPEEPRAEEQEEALEPPGKAVPPLLDSRGPATAARPDTPTATVTRPSTAASTRARRVSMSASSSTCSTAEATHSPVDGGSVSHNQSFIFQIYFKF